MYAHLQQVLVLRPSTTIFQSTNNIFNKRFFILQKSKPTKLIPHWQKTHCELGQWDGSLWLPGTKACSDLCHWHVQCPPAIVSLMTILCHDCPMKMETLELVAKNFSFINKMEALWGSRGLSTIEFNLNRNRERLNLYNFYSSIAATNRQSATCHAP